MAHGTAYWYNQIIAEKQSLSNLNGLLPAGPPNNAWQLFFSTLVGYLNNVYMLSQVGRWRLQAYITAYIINMFEQINDAYQAYIISLLAQDDYGTLGWWQANILAFQYGYILQQYPNTFQFYYADTTSSAAIAARIVSACAIVEQEVGIGQNEVVVKVATGGVGALEALSTPQANALEAYINQTQPPGIYVSFINLPPDQVKVTMTVNYEGTLDQPTFEAAILAAINNLFSTNQTPFNGNLFLNGYNDPPTGNHVWGWIDSLVAVPGCKGVVDVTLWARENSGSWVQVVDEYEPVSGYFVFDSVDSAITYNPQ